MGSVGAVTVSLGFLCSTRFHDLKTALSIHLIIMTVTNFKRSVSSKVPAQYKDTIKTNGKESNVDPLGSVTPSLRLHAVRTVPK